MSIPMLLHCPECGVRHVDTGEFATKPHHTHSCQNCGMTWRPAVVCTVGVRFLPGFKGVPLVGGVEAGGNIALGVLLHEHAERYLRGRTTQAERDAKELAALERDEAKDRAQAVACASWRSSACIDCKLDLITQVRRGNFG